MDVSDIAEKLRAGDRRTVARLISKVEDGSPDLPEIIRAITPLGGNAYVIGMTGSPGVGKSTLTGALVGRIRAAGRRVAVLAVDPSSPFTGGALLGDRLRMQDHATDPDVFIRSMATRGQLGGLAWAAPHALRILDAAGAEAIVLETVGVGQAEVEIANAADTTLVVTAPGMGDAVQANKAGILEIGDVYVVNKADRDGARTAARDLEQMLDLGAHRPWRPPVLQTVASSGEGVDELWAAIEDHQGHLESTGELRRRRVARTSREIAAIALAAMREAIGEVGGGAEIDRLAEDVVNKTMDPYTAADKLRAHLG